MPNEKAICFSKALFFEWPKDRVFYLIGKDLIKMKATTDKDSKARLIAMISREEMDFIDRIGKDALFSTGHRLSRTEVVSAILDTIAQLPVTGQGIYTEGDLRQRIEKAIEAKAKEVIRHDRMAI